MDATDYPIYDMMTKSFSIDFSERNIMPVNKRYVNEGQTMSNVAVNIITKAAKKTRDVPIGTVVKISDDSEASRSSSMSMLLRRQTLSTVTTFKHDCSWGNGDHYFKRVQ